MEEERKQRLRTSSLGRLQVKNERRNSIEELWKRKREKSDVEEQVKDKVAFQKSKKTQRSPLKTEAEMEQIQKMFADIQLQLKDIILNNTEMKEEIRSIKENWNREKIMLETKIIALEERLEKAENKIEGEEKRKRRNNIVITGWKMQSMEKAKEEVSNMLMNLASSNDLGIEEVQKIPVGEKYLIQVKFKNLEEKLKVMRNKNKLKGKNIYINDDLTKIERNIQKQIAARAKEEREKGNKTKMGYMKVKINENWWYWDKETLIKKN